MDVLKEVLADIKPTAKEEKEVSSKIGAIVKKVNSGLKDANAVLYGSGAKGTWLKGGFDADIFVKFEYSKFKDRSEEISSILGKHLRKNFSGVVKMHGSRDYYRIKDGQFIYEIIPILDIKKASQAENITDISPLHARWVKKKAGKKLVDDIRLAKAFLKANGLYGAESYIRGISGYVTEILVIHYGGFLEFLKKAVKWKDKEVIDTEKYHKNVFMSLNKSKLDSPIVVVDPVDLTRNAAAALSYPKVSEFKSLSKRFLRKPAKSFFEEEDVNVEKLRLKSKGKTLLLVDVLAMSGKEDVVGAKIMKCYEYMLERFTERDFEVKDSGWEWNKAKKAFMWFMFDPDNLSLYKEHLGPALEFKDHCLKFRKMHRNVVSRKGKLIAKVKREYVDASVFLKAILKDKWFKGKVKSIKLAASSYKQ